MTERIKGTGFCGVGQVSRTRTTIGPLNGGKPCLGSNTETRDCLVKNCQFKSASDGAKLYLHCNGGKKIEIIKAEYTYNGADLYCKKSIYPYLEVRERCDGKSECYCPVGEYRFTDPCPSRDKQLSVWYNCINPGIVKSGGLWREDRRCGKGFTLSDGVTQAECSRWSPGSQEKHGHGPCCSDLGWCGNSKDHCRCAQCVDYSTVCATIFEHGDYKGWGHLLPESKERYNLPSDLNDAASSVRVAPGCTFKGYENYVGEQGAPMVYTADANIRHDILSSYSCTCSTACATIYGHEHFKGWKLDLSESEVRTNLASDKVDKASSIKVRPGCTFKAYNHLSSVQETPKVYTADANKLVNSGFNDQLSSYSCQC